MEKPNYQYSYNLLSDWHPEWVKICNERSHFKEKFSKKQKEHFERLLNFYEQDIKKGEEGSKNEPRSKEELKFVKYSSTFNYINKVFLAEEERSPEIYLQAHLELNKMNELRLIFFHFYYLEYLDEESKEVMKEYLNPTEYNHRFELKILHQFLPNSFAITRQPKISIYNIDKEIVMQIDSYEGGEKIAFLEYQLEKVESPTKRLRSWKAYLKDFQNDFEKPSTFKLGLKFIKEQLSNSELIKLNPPLKVDLSVPQLALFYRLLHESGFYIDANLTDVFTMLNKAYGTKAKNYPSKNSLLKSNDKLTKRDVNILRELIDKLSKKVDANMTIAKE